MTVILLAEHDAEAALARLQAKVERGEPPNGVDRVDLLLLPLMRQSRPLGEVVAETLPLVAALPTQERPQTVGTILALAYHYLDEVTVQALLAVLTMANALEELVGAGILRGRAEGEIEGKRAAVRLAVRTRFGAVPTTLESRIAVADTEALDALLTRALTADRADQI